MGSFSCNINLSKQVTTIGGRQFFLFSYRQLLNMVFPHTCEVTTVWRIFWLQHRWSHLEVFAVDPISGEGKFILQWNFMVLDINILLYNRSVHNIRIERLWVDITARLARHGQMHLLSSNLYMDLTSTIPITSGFCIIYFFQHSMNNYVFLQRHGTIIKFGFAMDQVVLL